MAFRCSPQHLHSEGCMKAGRLKSSDGMRGGPVLGCEGMWTFRVQKLCHWNKLWAVASCWVLGTKTEGHSSLLSKTSFMLGGHRWPQMTVVKPYEHIHVRTLAFANLTLCYSNVSAVFRCAMYLWNMTTMWTDVQCHLFQNRKVAEMLKTYFLRIELRLEIEYTRENGR